MTEAKDLPDDANAPQTDEAPEAANAEASPREAELQLELAGVTEKLLRAMAETENVRRRLEQAAEDRGKYAVSAFAKDMLPIADNLRRALESIPADAKENDPLAVKLIEGVELTERSLLNALEKNGVKKFDPSGEKFDPNFQQAMYEVPDPSVPPGTVVQVVQAGYTIGERVLRPALVGVAKGGAKAPAGEQG